MKTHGGFLMTQIKQIGGRIFDHMLQDYGVSEFNGAQGKILYVLWEHHSLSIKRISHLTSLAQTTLTSMLDRKEKGGLIFRQHNPDNRREILISITPKADQLRADYEMISAQINEVYYKGFTEREITEHEQYLLRILINLTEYEKQNGRK